jgi:hypothetical protein
MRNQKLLKVLNVLNTTLILVGEGDGFMRLKPRYYSTLYLGKSIQRKKLDRIKRKLEHHPEHSALYLLAASRNPTDQLEIYSVSYLQQSYYQDNPPYIVGLAGTHQEAVDLVEQIVTDCLHARGDCRLKEFLLC